MNETLQKLAKEAIAVQDACNPMALAIRYAEVIGELKQVVGYGTQAISEHPVNRLWVSKLHDLAGMGLSDSHRFAVAYHECEELSKETAK